MEKTHYTPEERVVLFDKVVESIEGGLVTRKACELHGLNYHTFRLWRHDESFVPDSNSKYARAKIGLSESIVEDCYNIALAPAVKGEFGVDKGDVELRKVQLNFLQWFAGKLNKGYSEKSHEVEQKPADFGAITVNIIKDTRPQD